MKFFSKITGVIGVTLLVCLGQVSQSRAAAVLFDNLGQPGSGYSSTSLVSLAQAFTTTSTNYVLNEVSLPLWIRAGATGTYEILVWDSTGVGSSPGAQVGSAIHSGLAQNLSTTVGSLLTISGLNVALSPSTTYYLVSRNVSVSSAVDLQWKLSNLVTSSFYEFSSGSWGGPYPSNMEMKITAVPEPSSGALMVLGIGGVIALRRIGRKAD